MSFLSKFTGKEIEDKLDAPQPDSLQFEADGKKISIYQVSYEEEGNIFYEPALEIKTTQSDSSDFGRFQISNQGFTYVGMVSGVSSSLSIGVNGSVIAQDGSTGFRVSFVPNRKAIQLNNSVYVMTGTGSPEGVVSAPVGSLYLRSDGGLNTSMYVKESGTSFTGWVAK